MRYSLLRTLLLLTAAIVWHAGRSATYYISPTGNDSNNGTSQATAWQTLERFNQISFSLQPGDRVLLQRGGVYRGKININGSGTASSYIEVGAYGNGAQPIISGSVAVAGWTQHSGNIWRVPMSQAVKHVYVNGALQTIARFPNTGWLRVDQGTSTSLTDAELSQPNGYWTGATAVIRTTNWSYDTAYVSAFSNGVLTHSSTGNNLQSQQWGYFLRNKLELLDAPGEWFHDRAAGQLYLWCPNNANPNNVLVEASVTDFGVYVSWQRHHIKVDGIHFKHQHTASLRLSGTSDLEAMNCTFTDTWQAILSTGNNQDFHHLTVQRTYGTAISLLDNGTSLHHCTLEDIATVPGLGENNMGYLGIRMNGADVTVADNRLVNVGYIAIAVANNAVVERNVVINAMAILNDGGGISFDHADGAVIRNNIVRDLQGDIESCAPNWINAYPMCHGIYFGNTSIKNTLVKDNTVTNCSVSGIHVDHTMVSTGNRIEGNVLFNNKIQLSISDFSNYNGPGATAPYFVPAFNTVYTGNVLYGVTKDQLCMRQYHVNGSAYVDYGTFTNNRYFNPYNDRSIYLHNTFAGTHRYFTLERWQSTFTEDAGSTRSPLYLPSMEVLEVFGTNAVANGSFNSNVNGWGGWPTQGQLTHNASRLDGGCMRVSFTDNASYNTFNLKHSTNASLQQGSWYRLRFSIVSDLMGELTVGFKGISQLSTPVQEGERVFPFDANRRDVEHFFQSSITDQGACQFTNHYTEGVYFIDNIALERVSAVPVDPFERQQLLINEGPTDQTFSLQGCWSDTDGNLHTGSITLPAYRSVVLVKEDDSTCLTTGMGDGSDGTSAAANALHAFPNPASPGQSIAVEVPAGSGALMLYGLQGQLLLTERVTGARSMLVLPSGLGAGTYLLVHEDDGRRTPQRISVL
ncbi:MAG: right-handed parallel beta-helix repeat-containing protein [Flavobacteriales bacterium]|nr:MAG: right-handed parallel beta-helix repeat-containing protein [Flavobacteriales bacterium]